MKRYSIVRIGPLCVLAVVCLGMISPTGASSITGTEAREVSLSTPTQLVTATTTPSLSQPLFLDSPVPGRENPWPAYIRQRYVTINHTFLTTGNRLRLDLFGDVSLIAVLDRRQDRREAVGPAAGDGFIWRGHIDGRIGSEVTLVVAPDTIAGNVILPETHTYYHIGYAGDDSNRIHAIYEVDPSLIEPDEPIPPREDIDISKPERSKRNASSNLTVASSVSSPASPSVDIGLLVVFTQLAQEKAGGSTALKNSTVLGVDYANAAYTNSQIHQRLVLNNFRLIFYDEESPDLDHQRLHVSNDNQMDIVHHGPNGDPELGWRQIDNADLVTLLSVDGSDSGRADPYDETDQNGFSWVNWNSVGGAILGHELGHSMGCAHGRHNGGGGNWQLWSWGYGHPGGLFHDIMAYNCPAGAGPCPGIKHFSNPDVYYCLVGCFATGVHYLATDSADCARTINTTRLDISGWR